jgi:hypothetical protein
MEFNGFVSPLLELKLSTLSFAIVLQTRCKMDGNFGGNWY